jgi:o-succinylbenzoate synthase
LALGAVDLWMVELPFIRPVVTARGTHRSRPLVLVHLFGDIDGISFEGWGECAALADATYDTEDAALSFDVLERSLVPMLLGEVARAGGCLPPPSGLHDVRRAAPGAPLAFAALEMAVADAHLRVEGRPLAAALGVEGRAVPVGAVVGQSSSIDALVSEVGKLDHEGFTRVKMKIGPGWDVEPLDAVAQAAPGLRLQVDANGSYFEHHIDHLGGLDRFGLLCLEQPFDRSDLEGHARLAERISTPVCLDESLDSPESARRALAMGACSVVCIKPSRLGGLGSALDLVESCSVSGIPLWMGGMFESGYARGVNTTLAALPGFAWAGDLSPARRYLEDDLVPGPELIRVESNGELCVLPPRGAGLGTPPDPRTIKKYSSKHRSIRGDRWPQITGYRQRTP